VSGNSDFEIHDLPARLPRNLKRMYLQNSFISDSSKIFTLPIGSESIRWAKNGFPRLLSSRDPSSPLLNRVLIGPFGATHKIRTQVVHDFLSVPGPWDVLNTRLNPSELSELMKKYRWVASPRGNGVDTHRTWESLYRGVQPLVEADDWSNSLDYLKLPILKISDWTPDTLNELIAAAAHVEINPQKLAPLWLEYWANLFRH
jgi:hypothetical protein